MRLPAEKKRKREENKNEEIGLDTKEREAKMKRETIAVVTFNDTQSPIPFRQTKEMNKKQKYKVLTK